MAKSNDQGKLKCSFCGKPQDQVRKLIAGHGVYICDECVSLCSEIIEEEFELDEAVDSFNLYKPEQIKDFLDQYVIGQDDAKKALAVAVWMLSCRRVTSLWLAQQVQVRLILPRP